MTQSQCTVVAPPVRIIMNVQMSHEDRMALAQGIIGLLDHWGMSSEGQVAILALPDGTRPGAIRQHRQGTPLPDDRCIMERIEHLLGIADALRTAHPRNANMDTVWMNQPNRQLGERAPLVVMLEEGLNGVIAVRSLIDCSYDWARNGH